MWEIRASSSKEEVLKDEKFKKMIETGEVSPVFVEEVEGCVFDVWFVYELIYSENITKYEKGILSGEFKFKIDNEKLKINKKKFTNEMSDFLSVLTSENVDKELLSQIVYLYQKANDIVQEYFCVDLYEPEEISIMDICIFNNDENVTLDLAYINEKNGDWFKDGYMLFGFSEDGGAFYIKIKGEDLGSIFWCDHDTDEMYFISKNTKKFVKLILG